MLTGYFFSDDGIKIPGNKIPVSGQKITLSRRIIKHWISEQSELNKNRTDRIQDNEYKTTGQCSTSQIL
jgi:hypothetical protein